MAADQLNKRSNATSVVGYTSREHHKVKKKKVETPHNDLNMRSNISLEWDEKKKSVVAKREQIGIARRELIPFLDTVPHRYNILADVFTAPHEIFELENLTKVLSYEVWQSHLSEKERKFLSQFLPKGAEVHKVVQELFAGDNFHFGNPFLEWGASLCSRNCHPDVVLCQELCSKANKRAYYSELQTYHNNMIGNLQTWKERWATCKDSEKEFMQKICRLRKDSEKYGSVHAIESRFCDTDENLGATSESCSWVADDRACSSDSPNLKTMHGETLRRICSKGFVENKYYESADGHKRVARLGNGEKLRKRIVECDDGAKYMSYIKVSKEQHQRVKSSMKPSSNSIQPRSLNHVLGSLDTFCVQPYEVFEEEERQKLHEHWYQLASRDLPAVFENRRKWQSEKWQLTKSLGQEIKEKLNSLEEDEEKEEYHNLVPVEMENEASDLEPIVVKEDEEREKSDSLHHEQMDVGETNHDPSVTSEDEEDVSSDSICQQPLDNGAANPEPAMEHICEDEPFQNQPLEQNALLGANQEFHSVGVDPDNNNQVLGKADDFSPSASEYTENLSHADVPVGQGDALPSAGEIWRSGSLPSAYYQHPTSVSREYRSASEFSLGHPQAMQDQPTQVIDLESDVQEEDPGRNFLQRHSGGGDSFFGPYPIQDRNELLLQSLFKSPGSLPYHHEQKQAGPDFHPTSSNIMLEAVNFSGNMRDTSMPLELRQKRLNDLYLHQNIQENIYADGGSRYSIPRQEHFSPVNNIQDWAVNGNVNISSSSHSLLNGGEILNQNWFSGEHRSGDGWSGSEGAVSANQSFGNGSNGADQSLFSVLSQCNGLRSGAPYGSSVGNSELLIQPGTFGVMSGAGVPGTSNVLQQPGNPLNYLNSHEASGSLRANSIGWMSVPHQNNALQDSMGKTFLRSWNH